MHVGIDARLNAYRDGGIAEYTRRIAGALAALPSPHTYTLIQHRRARHSGGMALPAGTRTAYAFTPPHHALESITFGAEIAPLRLDVLHSPDFIPPRFGARRYVITVHDLTFLLYPETQTPDATRYYAGQIRRAVQQAAHILTDAHATKADLIRLLGVPPEKVSVHHLGVDEAFRPLPPESVQPFLAARALPAGYLLFVGTFEPRKNLRGLISAYAALRAQLPDCPPLVIAGRRGWLYEPLFEQATALNLGKSLIWVENLPTAEMPALYNGAAVLVLPSFYEGFGFPALEAMACGVPTVVSERGSLPEVVGETGLYCDPDSPDSITAALARALTDSTFRAESRAAGLTRAAGFTWRSAAESVLAAYTALA